MGFGIGVCNNKACNWLLFLTFALTNSIAYATPYGGDLAPLDSDPVLILQRYEPTASELPIGGYLVPNSSVVAFRSNAQKNALLFGALFGIAGVIGTTVAESPEATDFKDRFQFNLYAELRDQIRKTSLNTLPLLQNPSSKNAQLKITPQGFIRIKDDGSATMTIQLEVQLIDEEGEEKWRNRYSYMPSVEHPLIGTGSWLENNNTRFQQIANNGIQVALQALAMDLKQKPYTETKPIGSCRIEKVNLSWVGTLNDKAVVKEVINRRAGTFTHFFDRSDCQASN